VIAMKKWGVAAAAVVGLCGSVEARVIEFFGVVTEQHSPGVDPLVALGDTLTIRFAYDPATQPRASDAGLSDNPFVWLFGPGFEAYMSNGLRWRSSQEYSNGFVLLYDEPGKVPGFDTWLVPSGTAALPPLRASHLAFRIEDGQGYYGNQTRSLGFSGLMIRVPEPETWGMMVLGFGAVGAVSRRWRPSARGATSTS
jgi:hypothetical protein